MIASQRRVWLLLGAALFLSAGFGLFVAAEAGWLKGLGQDRSMLSFEDQLGPKIGHPAPEFELYNLEGELVGLDEQQGRPVVLNFWATWCAPCVLEMPMIQRYYEEKAGAFEVLAVNADQPEREVQIFAQDIGITFPVLLDPGGRVQALYRLRGYPTTFILDASGNIRIQHIGVIDREQLVSYLEQVGVVE